MPASDRVVPDPRFDRPVFARLRKQCLSFPGTSENKMWGHPGFQVRNRTFCVFEIVDDRPSVGVRLAARDARRIAKGRHFFLTPYGRGVWVSRWMDVDVDPVETACLIEQSLRHRDQI